MQPPTPTRSDSATLLQALASGLGVLMSLAAAALFGLGGLAGVFSETLPRAETVGVFTLAWIGLLLAFLAAPSLIYSIQRLEGRAAQWPVGLLGYRMSWALLLVWPLVLALGSVVAKSNTLAWLLLPPLNLLGVGIPIWWLVEMARHGLPSGGPRRGWGTLNFSIFLTTPVILVVEILGFVVVLVLVILAVSSNPAWADEIQRLATRLSAIQNNPENLLPLLRPFLQNPLVVYLILAVLSGMAPLIEELLKPLAMWALVRRNPSPAQGFALGAICGGAFALLESLLNLTNAAGDGWATLVLARSGTATLHIAATALVGWGLGSAWSRGAYLRLGLAYLGATFLHGLWNGLSVMTLYETLIMPGTPLPEWITMVAPEAPRLLAALAVALLLLLWGANRALRREHAALPQSVPAGD